MTKRKRSPETKLRYARAEIRALREELEARRNVGQQMSNLCFNLAQRGGNEGVFRDCYRDWDAIKSVPEAR